MTMINEDEVAIIEQRGFNQIYHVNKEHLHKKKICYPFDSTISIAKEASWWRHYIDSISYIGKLEVVMLRNSSQIGHDSQAIAWYE